MINIILYLLPLLKNRASSGMRAVSAVSRLLVAAVLTVSFGANLALAQSNFSWTSPAGGETFYEGDTVNLSWSGGDPSWTVYLGIVDSALWANAGTLTGSTPNDGSFTRQIPQNFLPGSAPRQYQFYVQDTNATNWSYRPKFTIAPSLQAPVRRQPRIVS